MSVARTVAEILAEHVTLEIEGIDRLYLNVYVPRLQHVGGVVGFLRGHRGQPIASPPASGQASVDGAAQPGVGGGD